MARSFHLHRSDRQNCQTWKACCKFVPKDVEEQRRIDCLSCQIRSRQPAGINDELSCRQWMINAERRSELSCDTNQCLTWCVPEIPPTRCSIAMSFCGST